AYAGSNNETIYELIGPLITDSSQSMQVSAMAALTCGLVYVGSTNSEVSQAIIATLMDDDRQNQLTDKWTRFLALGMGLLYFGLQEDVDVIKETLRVIDHAIGGLASVLAEICAWAGTGTVLKIQDLLHICNEHQVESEEQASGEGEKKGDELLQGYAVLGI